jgi:hypothetical protein
MSCPNCKTHEQEIRGLEAELAAAQVVIKTATACLEDLPSGDLFGVNRLIGAQQRAHALRTALKNYQTTLDLLGK